MMSITRSEHGFNGGTREREIYGEERIGKIDKEEIHKKRLMRG